MARHRQSRSRDSRLLSVITQVATALAALASLIKAIFWWRDGDVAACGKIATIL